MLKRVQSVSPFIKGGLRGISGKRIHPNPPLQKEGASSLKRVWSVSPFIKGGLRGIFMTYNKYLKKPARQLRSHQTQAELALWQRLRRKQIHGVQFYRQRPLDRFIVDFYCPSACLVVECDGSQHHTPEGLYQDQQRDNYLQQQRLQVLRFNNRQILTQLDAVCVVIAQAVAQYLDNNLRQPNLSER